MIEELQDLYKTKKTILSFSNWLDIIFSKNMDKKDDEVLSIAKDLLLKYD